MSRAATPGDDLLRLLRREGFVVEDDGDRLLVSPASRLTDDLRAEIRDRKPALVDALRRERLERLLDLATVDPRTGLPDLPANELATARQVERLRELAEDPALSPHRERVRDIVQRALDRGLSQLAAYGLIGDLGRRIAERRRRDHGAAGVEPRRCPGCGRPVGPTANVCGSCKRERRRPEGDQ